MGDMGHPGVTLGVPADLNTRCPSFKPRPMKSLALPPLLGSCGHSGGVRSTLTPTLRSPPRRCPPAHRAVPQQQPLGAVCPQLQLDGVRCLRGAAGRGGRCGGCSTPGRVQHPEVGTAPRKGARPRWMQHHEKGAARWDGCNGCSTLGSCNAMMGTSRRVRHPKKGAAPRDGCSGCSTLGKLQHPGTGAKA